LAVAALRDLLGDPGPLQRVIALGIQTLDCGDLFVRGLRYCGLAGTHRFTIEVDSASATQAGATTKLRTGHLQMFADDAVDGAHSAASMCQRVVALKRTTMRGAVHGRD